MRWPAVAVLAGLLCAAAPAHALQYQEVPTLAEAVTRGELPPVAERLPRSPRVIDLPAMGRETGRHGGAIRMLMGGQRDIRMMTIYGYTRLVTFDEGLELVPDVLESFEVHEDRDFILRLRPGHRWSDGNPLTAEDFRYAWEDVMQNPSLSPVGPPLVMLVDGERPVFEIIDPYTVRYTWSRPNPAFLPALAQAQPLELVLPAHYLKAFHEDHQTPQALSALLTAQRVRNWTALHQRMARHYRPENPERPVLDPWVNTTAPPSDRFVFVRNPYFHRVDQEGHQLPYVDRFELAVSTTAIIPAKTGTGAADLQVFYLRFDDYTFLKEAETRQHFRVLLWERGQGSRIAILPNLNYEDPVWRQILHDVRFRRALSLGIDRHEINQAVYYGLARESADAPIPKSPLYRPEYEQAWSRHDPHRANALLDAIGLIDRNDDGLRLLPDGRPMEIIIESAGESTEETDVLELVTDHWQALGIRLFVRSSQRDVFRSRVIGGRVMMSVWSGLDNGLASPDMSPRELAPTSESQLQWPQWGLHYQSHGQQAEAPDLPEVLRLLELLRQWGTSASRTEREEIWHRMLELYTDQVFSIGVVNSTLQPVVVSRALRNVPEKGYYSFDPGAYLGMYLPDTFWLDGED